MSGSFTSGVWSESHDVLGLVDDQGTLFFVKANGEEITASHEKAFEGLLISFRCPFTVLTSDGFLHHVGISREPSASAASTRASNNVSAASSRASKPLLSWKESLSNVVDFTWWSDHVLTKSEEW